MWIIQGALKDRQSVTGNSDWEYWSGGPSTSGTGRPDGALLPNRWEGGPGGWCCHAERQQNIRPWL